MIKKLKQVFSLKTANFIRGPEQDKNNVGIWSETTVYRPGQLRRSYPTR